MSRCSLKCPYKFGHPPKWYENTDFSQYLTTFHIIKLINIHYTSTLPQTFEITKFYFNMDWFSPLAGVAWNTYSKKIFISPIFRVVWVFFPINFAIYEARKEKKTKAGPWEISAFNSWSKIKKWARPVLLNG